MGILICIYMASKNAFKDIIVESKEKKQGYELMM